MFLLREEYQVYMFFLYLNTIQYIMIMCLIYSVSILLMIVPIQAGVRDLNIYRVLTCVEEDKVSCLAWNESISIQYYQGDWEYGCFSEEESVMTEEGIKSMREIQIGDKILGMNLQTRQTVFTDIIAWLHRDTNSQVQYTQIKCQNTTYSSSPYHNIAYLEQDNIKFKYAENLMKGDKLISAQNQILTVESVNDRKFSRGMYSPYTGLGNFFIFAKDQSEMILVHCLAEVKLQNENNKEWFHNLLTSSFVDFLGTNAHPNKQQQKYLHPGAYLLGAMNGFQGAPILKKTNNSQQINIEEFQAAGYYLFFTNNFMNEYAFFNP